MSQSPLKIMNIINNFVKYPYFFVQFVFDILKTIPNPNNTNLENNGITSASVINWESATTTTMAAIVHVQKIKKNKYNLNVKQPWVHHNNYGNYQVEEQSRKQLRIAHVQKLKGQTQHNGETTCVEQQLQHGSRKWQFL